jgi:hypothetical protein
MGQATHISALLLAALHLLAAAPGARAQEPAVAAGPDLPGPVVASGHGALLDAQGREVEATPGLVLETQRAYVEALAGRLDAAGRAAFEGRRRALAGDAPAQADLVHANAALIAGLIAQVGPADAARWASLNAALRDRLTARGGPAPSEAMARRLADDAAAAAAPALAPAAATGTSGAAYIDECRAAGVPIPPDWGSPAWKSRGVLNDEFISAGLEAEVFVFESGAPRGVCVALPRSAGGNISLLGVICQGNDTSRACFWDNANVPKGATVPLASFKGGAALLGGDVCTDCHAGRNPFVVHPGTPLDIGGILAPNAWHQPLAPAGWPQNPGPTTQLDGVPVAPGEGSCAACHGGLPQLSKAVLPGYCAAVMGNAIGRTMPPAGPAAALDHFGHAQAIAELCGLPPPAAPAGRVMQMILLPAR